MLELDLIGQTIRLSEGDVRWIEAQAKAASGHSLGARDLATRLRELDPDRDLNRLLFTRPESSVLARLLEAGDAPPARCDELRRNLAKLLGSDEQRRRGMLNDTEPTPAPSDAARDTT